MSSEHPNFAGTTSAAAPSQKAPSSSGTASAAPAPAARARSPRRLTRLSEAFDPSNNSLAFLRLFFAAMVLVSHSFPLGGFNHGLEPTYKLTDSQEDLGGLAVAGFFVISGFLVTRSFVTSSTALRYMWKRFLRIFPGFWVCLLVTAALIAPLAYFYQHNHLTGYLGGHSDSPVRYVQANFWLGMNQYNIDHLLGGTPWARNFDQRAFDGSLWTLIYEFKCYIAIAILGVFGVLRHGRYGIVAVSAALWAVLLVETRNPHAVAPGFPVIGDPWMVRLAFLFSLGTLLFLFQEKIPISGWLAAMAGAVFAVSLRTPIYPEVGQIAFAYLCFWLAVRLPIRNADRYGDFSYGLYIYAFPVQQMASLNHLNRWGLVPYVLITFTASLGLAVASWHFVEKPAMDLKRLKMPTAWQATWDSHKPTWWPERSPRRRVPSATPGRLDGALAPQPARIGAGSAVPDETEFAPQASVTVPSEPYSNAGPTRAHSATTDD